jgi:hypothetical protein
VEQEGKAVAQGLTVIDPLKTIKGIQQLHNAKAAVSPLVYGDPIKDDFRVFLTLLWRHLKLPDPTPLQLDIAWYLQHHERTGEIDHLILMAFRGAAKSWITGAYVLWTLHRDPQKKVLVASGSVRRSIAFVNWCLSLIAEWPLLQYLRPKPNQRQSAQAFDVGPARPDQTPSVFAVGITAQIVGFRGDLIVGDDVETNTNSMTPVMREKLADSVKEFDAIIKPGGQIIFLGTPQTEASIYNELAKRGYRTVIYPARYPTGKQRRLYGDKLAQYIGWKLDLDPSLAKHSTEPTRFSDEDLLSREISWGKAGFALQFMLDTTLSDIDRYPLRLGDIITMSLDRRNGPDLVAWGNGEHLIAKEVEVIAFDGDRAYKPASVSDSYSKYQAIRAFIDPSGKGKDETTLTIGAVLHSTPFVLKQAGWLDGYSPETLTQIAKLLVEFNVQTCRVEEDFGQGMFAQLLRPYVKKAWEEKNAAQGPKRPGDTRTMTEIVSERAAKVQKELRILEVLEPVFQAHRLVIATEVLQDDYRVTMGRDGTDLRDRYSLMYQITRLTREKDCLTHDDRVEGLAGLVSMFLEEMGLMPMDQARKAEQARVDDFERQIMMEAANFARKGRMGGLKLRGGLRRGGPRG